MKEIKVAKLFEDAKLPTRKHPTDAGMDLYYYEPDTESVFEFGEVDILNTGITVEIPDGYVGLIWPKSKSDFLIGGGVIDSGYQGEILIKIVNPSREPIFIKHGDAIAQLLIQPIETPLIKELPKEEIHQVESSRKDTGGIVTQTTYLQSKLEFGNSWD